MTALALSFSIAIFLTSYNGDDISSDGTFADFFAASPDDSGYIRLLGKSVPIQFAY